MAKHVRQQVRESAKMILTGLPTTGARVFTGDPFAKSADDGPFLRIAAPDDSRDDDLSDLGSKTGRRMTLVVIGEAEAKAIEDVLEAIALEVEAALEGQTFGGLASPAIWMRTTKDFDDAGKVRSGDVRIEFAVPYRVRAGQPETSIG
jgi:hypothetical protein